MNENVNISPGTFDIVWDELYVEEFNNTFTEMTPAEFKEMHGVDITEFDTELKTPESTEIIRSNKTQTSTFVQMNTEDVHTFITEQCNKNTLKKTLSDIRKFEQFLKTKNEKREMCEIAPELLDEYIATFVLSIRKQSGEEYEPSSLRNIVSSIDRKLMRHKYGHSIMGDQSSPMFQLTRDAVAAKQKSLKKMGKGNKPKRSSPINDDEINILYSKGVLGDETAKSVLNTVWFNNCILFGLRGTQENYQLRWGDVELKTASDGTEYLELNERQTKTRTGENINDVRAVTPKIFQNKDRLERCPVKIYKLYASKRPTDFCSHEHPFYLAPRTISQKENNETWFMKMNLGVKKIGNMLKQMAKDADLDSRKRITNHSARKHLVQKLRDSGVAPTDIMQISGHKNVQSVLNYSNMSETTHRKCSNILSNNVSNTTLKDTYCQNTGLYRSSYPAPCTFPDPDPFDNATEPPQGPTIVSDLPSTTNPMTTPVSLPVVVSKSQNTLLSPDSCQNVQTLSTVTPPTSGNTARHISVENMANSSTMQMSSMFSGAVLNVQTLNVFTHPPK